MASKPSLIWFVTQNDILGIKVKYEQIQFMIITAYMPNDDNSESSYNTYGDILAEISSIIGSCEHDVILGGDLNVDFSRNN